MKKKKNLVVFLGVIVMLSACSSEKVEMGTLSEQTVREDKKQNFLCFTQGRISTGLQQWKNYVKRS